MTTTLRFQRTETIIVELDIKDQDGNYVDPATTIQVTITDPDGTAVVDDKAMTKDATGQYHYDYTSGAAAVLGWYSTHFVVTDSTRVTIHDTGFTLEV